MHAQPCHMPAARPHAYSCDIASEGRLLWEGFMGACTPALLFRQAVNLEPSSAKRHEVGEAGAGLGWACLAMPPPLLLPAA